jgi:phosphomannomutase
MTEDFRHDFDPSALREYDVRGIVGKTLHEADAYALGRAFADVLHESGKPTVAVGRDGRLSSPALEGELLRGLADGGVTVLRIGVGPTPMLYYAATVLGTGGGIMVTGSHNPADYNGFKIVLGGKPFFGPRIQDLGARTKAGHIVTRPMRGNVFEVDIKDGYAARLAYDWDGQGPGLTVVWDCGNGAAGEVLARLLPYLPGVHHVINQDIDGRFPAHHPDPTVASNLRQLIDEVRRTGADVGIAFDGDADRIGAVDGKGNIVAGDQLLTILARDVLRERPGATIIADVKASRSFFDEVAAAGGMPMMWKTGHSLIKTRMAETGSPLAGEMSGHVFFADKWYGFDDALYAAVRLLGLLDRSSSTLAQMRAALPIQVNTPELRFDCDDVRKFGVVAEVAGRLRDEGACVSDVDGVRVTTDDGWWLLRASNTQSVLVARAESGDEAGLERLKGDLSRQLVASGLETPDFSGENAGH